MAACFSPIRAISRDLWDVVVGRCLELSVGRLPSNNMTGECFDFFAACFSPFLANIRDLWDFLGLVCGRPVGGTT